MAKIISVRNPITKNIESEKLIGAIETSLGFEDDCYKMVNGDASFKTIFKTQVFDKLAKLKKRVYKKRKRKNEAELKKYDNRSIFKEYSKIASNYNNKLEVCKYHHENIKIDGLKLDVYSGNDYDKLRLALSKSMEVKVKAKKAFKGANDLWNDETYNFHHFFQDLDVIREYMKDHKERQKDKENFLKDLNEIIKLYNQQAMVWNNKHSDLKINEMNSVK